MSNSIKELWFVIPLDLKPDQTKPTIGSGRNLDFAMPQDAAPQRARARREGEPVVEPVAQAGYGYPITAKDQKLITHAFTSKKAAEDHAIELASKQPKTMFGVFGCLGTYETTTPTVVKKQFNPDGELVPEVV